MTSRVKGRVECRKFLRDTAPHYGLRYGPAPATGNFQRLRGRPPLVSSFKVVYEPFFHGDIKTATKPVPVEPTISTHDSRVSHDFSST
jgi:hypothetical protein